MYEWRVRTSRWRGGLSRIKKRYFRSVSVRLRKKTRTIASTERINSAEDSSLVTRRNAVPANETM